MARQVKIEYKGELRRISLPETNLSLAQLLKKITDMYSLEGQAFVLNYRDGEALLPLTSESECTLAFSKAQQREPPTLRVVVMQGVTEQPKTEIKTFSSTPEVPATPSCNSCGAVLAHLHYKCLNCLDVELCEACEESSKHNVHHLLVKLRVPISTFPVQQQLIFLSHIEAPAQKDLAKQQKQQLQEVSKLAKLKAREQKKLLQEAERRRKEQEKEEKKRQKLAEKEAKNKLKLVEKEAKAELTKLKEEKAQPKKQLKMAEEPVDVQVSLPMTDSLFVVPSPSEMKDSLFALIMDQPPVSAAVAQPEDISLLISEFQQVADDKDEVAWDGGSVQQDEASLLLSEEKEKDESLLFSFSQEENEPATEEQVVIAPQDIQVEASAPEVQETAANQDKHHPFKENLERLAEMGFTDKEKNIRALVKNVNDLEAAVEQLLHTKSSWLPEFFPSLGLY